MPPHRLLPVPLACAAAVAACGADPGAPVARDAGCRPDLGREIRDGFPTPAVRRSHDGVLRTRLTQAPATARVAGHRTRTTLYAGSLPGPTLVVCPGDRIDVALDNRSREPTSLHPHGLHVSPFGRGDDVLRHVGPGTVGAYRFAVPRDHPAGTYWYHPHAHGRGETQISGGLAGTLVVADGAAQRRAGIADIPQRTMVLQRMTVRRGRVVGDGAARPRDARVLVNGRLRPVVRVTQGRLQRWRLVNASADAFLRLRLPGQALRVVGTDGNPVPRPYAVTDLLLPPGSRRDVVVRGGRRDTRLQTRAFDAGFVRTAPQTIAPVRVTRSTRPPAAWPRGFAALEDLRRAEPDARRRVTFTQRFPDYFINGRRFDPGRVDAEVELGALEEWTIVNDSDEWHTFHIHQNPVQVVARDGRPVRRLQHEDNPGIPPGETLTVRMRFRDFPGVIPFHCHMLSHQDGGMMSLIRVVAPGAAAGDTTVPPAHHHH